MWKPSPSSRPSPIWPACSVKRASSMVGSDACPGAIQPRSPPLAASRPSDSSFAMAAKSAPGSLTFTRSSAARCFGAGGRRSKRRTCQPNCDFTGPTMSPFPCVPSKMASANSWTIAPRVNQPRSPPVAPLPVSSLSALASVANSASRSATSAMARSLAAAAPACCCGSARARGRQRHELLGDLFLQDLGGEVGLVGLEPRALLDGRAEGGVLLGGRDLGHAPDAERAVGALDHLGRPVERPREDRLHPGPVGGVRVGQGAEVAALLLARVVAVLLRHCGEVLAGLQLGQGLLGLRLPGVTLGLRGGVGGGGHGGAHEDGQG